MKYNRKQLGDQYQSMSINEKGKKLKFLSTILLISIFISFSYHYLLLGGIFSLSWPSGELFQPKNDLAGDFILGYYILSDMNPYEKVRNHAGSWPFPYGPASLLLYLFFSQFSLKIALGGFYVFFILCFIYLNIKFFCMRELKTRSNLKNILALSLTSYPFLYLMSRGNIESYLFLFITIGIFAYFKNHMKTANLFLVLATAMKFYPGIFFLIYIKDKKYKDLIYAFLFGIFFSLFSFSIFKGGPIFQIKSFFGELKLAQTFDFVNMDSITIAYPLKMFYLFFAEQFGIGVNMTLFALIYLIFAVVCLLGIIYVFYKFKLQKWEQVMLLLIPVLLLPPISFDYRLIAIFIPLFLFVNKEEVHRYDGIFLILFSLLLIPKKYLNVLLTNSNKSILYLIGETFSSCLTIIFLILFCILIIKKNRAKTKTAAINSLELL